DFARALGYPRRRRDVPRFVRDARRRTIDVGEMNGRVFVNSAGVGIDGHVAQRIAATSRVTGKTFGYFAGSLVGIATYRPEPMRVLVDGELHSGRFLTVVAANGTHFGSGMHDPKCVPFAATTVRNRPLCSSPSTSTRIGSGRYVAIPTREPAK